MNLTKRLLLSMFLSLSFCAISMAQTVTGTVTGSDGEPLVGATVQVQGSTTGVATDIDGMYSITASNGDMLEISYIGFRTQTITVSGTTMDVVLEEDATTLNDVVVTATLRPVRKLQATTAINSVGARELATKKPESFTDAIENTPGITVNTAQGRKGGFNIRGFPGGNVYTTTLIDGLPAAGISNLSSGTQEFFAFDPTVERIEVVRGAAATLFGRAAGAGAINIISKTGGKETHGSISLTKYNNVAEDGHQFEGDFDFRADWGVNGSLTDNLRFNIGGFFLNDSGQKEQHHKDEGSQIRFNLDWLISDKSKIRLSGSYLNTSFNNNIDTPWDFNENEPGGGFTSSQTFSGSYEQFNDLFGSLTFPIADEDGSTFNRSPADFQERTIGGNIAIDALFDLGQGWSLNQKGKYQTFDWNDVNDISFSDFYDSTVTNDFRFLGRSEQDNSSYVTETRISKLIDGANSTHSITAGLFYSFGERDRLGTNLFFRSDINPRPTFQTFFGLGLRSSATTSHREEKSTGFFVGDEMVFNDKLSVNIGFRYDWFNAFFSTDPEEIRSSGVNVPSQQEDAGDETINVREKFEDYSFSIGANYLLGESSAIYANYLRAFSLPSVVTRTFMRPDGNEIINNLEVGFRGGFGDFVVDATIFSTNIDNRVALALNQTTMEFEPRAGGENTILGGEIALTYTPKAVSGLLIRSNITLQKSEYANFLIPLGSDIDQDGNLFGLNIEGSGTTAAINAKGNQVEGTPRSIFSTNISYNQDKWGIDFGGFTYGGTVADATNLFDTPNLSIYNAGAYIAFPMANNDNELRLSLRVKNLFDAATPQSLFATTRDDAQLAERQANATTPAGRYAWSIIQNPRRVLLTAQYSF